MRKKFAEDDLLGKFRLKNNSSLRIDLKQTPPEQVEEVIKKMEPLIETLGTPENSQSSLSIDWNTNEIEVPENMPSDEELKAILFHDPEDEVPPDKIDIFKSQRHQKMLELLAKVEALTQNASVDETQFNETLSKSPVEHVSEDLRDSGTEGSLFNGEEAEMRSYTEQFQAVQGKKTAAEPKASATDIQDPSTDEKVFKLDVDHEDFQERLIRILNENYSDMGEIRPHNLKSRLIEILNEEYSDDYLEEDEFEEDELEQDSEQATVFESDSEATFENNLETNVENSLDELLKSDSETMEEKVPETTPNAAFEPQPEVEPEPSQQSNETSVQLTNSFDQPKMVLPGMRDASGFLSEEFNHNSPDFKPSWENSKKAQEDQSSDYPPVRKNRERFSHFQYVTSFQEVTDSEVEPADKPEMDDENAESESESAWTPLKATDEEINDSLELTTDPETNQGADPSFVDPSIHYIKHGDELSKDEHPWLKELREEGGAEGSIPETAEIQPELEHKWAPARVFGVPEQESEQETLKEQGWDRDHRQKEGQAPKAERLFGAEAAETAKSESASTEKTVAQNGERYMSVDEWSFVFDTLKEQIDYLRKQLEIKDHQLQNKDELIRNFQILLKNEQDKFLKLENKMEDVVLQVEERAAKKGFFSRFRKR
jgi:hypothetical protein